MKTTQELVISFADGMWSLQSTAATGKIQEYRCATEEQARQLAMLLMPTPDSDLDQTPSGVDDASVVNRVATA